MEMGPAILAYLHLVLLSRGLKDTALFLVVARNITMQMARVMSVTVHLRLLPKERRDIVNFLAAAQPIRMEMVRAILASHLLLL